MATHSSVLAWRIPGTGEPGGLPSMGSQRVGHDCSDLAVAATTRVIIFFLFYVCVSTCVNYLFTSLAYFSVELLNFFSLNCRSL